MNYIWKEIVKQGQDEIGYVENYNVMTDKNGKKFAYVNMYYLPLFYDDVKKKEEKKIVSVVIKWNLDILTLTDGSRVDLMLDIEEIINLNDKENFGRSNKKIEYYFIQIYVKHDSEEYGLLTHGDMHVIN